MSLRPTKLQDIVGQSNIKERLKILIDSIKNTNEALDHCLFYGNSGTGKTLLAEIVANELEYNIEICNAANINSIKDILPYLMRVTENSILFIDEAHQLPNKIQDFLLTAIEQNVLNLGKDNELSIKLPNFTFICATTDISGLLPALMTRFVLKFKLEPYNVEEMCDIVTNNSKELNLCLSEDAILTIAKTCRGIPRIVNNRLKWIRHYATSKDIASIDNQHILETLKLEKIDKNGLDQDDYMYLRILKKNNPCGINSLASLTNLPKKTILDYVEPFLLQLGLVKIGKKGRYLV